MPNIVPPSADRPITDENRTMSEPFRAWTQAINRLDPIVGTGSPESVIEAGITQLYMDDSGTSGSILYIKKQASISNDPKRGWVAV